MPRIAVVTGGTRGIAAAASKALKTAGMKVAANYRSNDGKAREFSEQYEMPVFKWDVSDYIACRDGIGAIEGQMGAVDVLVNDAGITRHATILKLSSAQWREVIDVNLGKCQGGVWRHERARFWPHRQYRFNQQTSWAIRSEQLCRRQSGHPWVDQGAGARRRPLRDYRQHRGARLL